MASKLLFLVLSGKAVHAWVCRARSGLGGGLRPFLGDGWMGIDSRVSIVLMVFVVMLVGVVWSGVVWCGDADLDKPPHPVLVSWITNGHREELCGMRGRGMGLRLLSLGIYVSCVVDGEGWF